MKRKKLAATHCECGGVMVGRVCQICRWWPGREEPPGESVDLEAAVERLAAYIREHAVSVREGGAQ